MPVQIITTTTNGTVALRACETAREVLAGALLNMDALAARLLRHASDNVLLVCAGTFRELGLEDLFAAGMLCSRFQDADLSDAALTARSVFQQYHSDPYRALEESKNGRALLSKNRGEDVRWCSQVSTVGVVGVMQAGAICNESWVP
jgi:2-phosphosulfolactate phosphatase